MDSPMVELAQPGVDKDKVANIPKAEMSQEQHNLQPSPEDIALQQQIDMMREMQAREEIAQAQGQGEENMNPTNQANQEIPEMPPVETISASVTKMETPKKSLWKWSSLDIENFLKDLAIKMKLDKVVEVVKNVVQAPFKAFGRLWTSGDAPRTPINPPPGLPQAI